MSEGLAQITIPDFDDDDLNTSSIPFGRTAGFGSGFGASAGQESPTSTGPSASAYPERSFFHSRGDSVTSEDSTYSYFGPSKSGGPFAHSSQSSLVTTVTGGSTFTRKSSFASLRNVLKGGKSSSNDPPPVPSLDRQAYPALKNPFSRSATSLAQSSITSTRRPSTATSPTQHRPPTPASLNVDSKHARGFSFKSKVSTAIRPAHSHSGSAVHNSDAGSDYAMPFGHPRSATPPPVPRMPNEYGSSGIRIATPPLSDNEDKVALDPRTPSEYALHAVFMRFAAAAELKIESFLKQGLGRETSLAEFMSTSSDPNFESLLQSLGRIATHSAKAVIDSILRWRKSQRTVNGDIIRFHLSGSGGSGRSRPQEVIDLLNERKFSASTYIAHRALIVAIESISRDALGDQLALTLEEITFEQFKHPDLKSLAQSVNHRVNMDLSATLLGRLSQLNFESVADRFVAELSPVASGLVSKDLEAKYEVLVKGLRHIEIKVWPPEKFEEGAEFVESLSKAFENAHGLRLKTAFAETLVSLLHPIGKTAQAEVNHPGWSKAMEVIYPRAREMMSKPRYWHVAYPLAITSLCVAPTAFFLKNWTALVEASIPKLKDRPGRVPALNGLLRLVWTYLYRCHEPQSTTNAKMDSILKHFFPPSKSIVYPDENLEFFVYIVHFVLSRHFEFGRDLTLNLMQENPMRGAQPSQIPNLLASERMNVAVESILLSLTLIEREEPIPSWPSSTNFFEIPDKEDYPSEAGPVPEALISKPGMQEFFDRCGPIISSVAKVCANPVGRMSFMDEQWAYSRFNLGYDDISHFIIRQHPEASVAYPSNVFSQVNALQVSFNSWPRCLHPSLPLEDAVDMLIRGLVHVEPAVGDAASASLLRFVADPVQVSAVVHRFSRFLFSPGFIATEGTGTHLLFQSSRVARAWHAAVESWVDIFSKQPFDEIEERDAMSIISLLQLHLAGSLFLLCVCQRSVRHVGIKVLKVLDGLVTQLAQSSSTFPQDALQHLQELLDTFTGRKSSVPYFDGHDALLDAKQQARVVSWKRSVHNDILIRLAESDDERDKVIWKLVYPTFIRSALDLQSPILNACRDSWMSAVSRYHGPVAIMAGIQNARSASSQPPRSPAISRQPAGGSLDNQQLIEQWHLWTKLLCCTSSPVETKATPKREHGRMPSDLSHDRERLNSTRGLFRTLTPFLDSDHSIFRDVAVMCISSFPSAGYSQLLEDLGGFGARHFSDDPRAPKASLYPGRRNRRQDRLYLAVAHIYQLTGHYLKEQRGMARQDSLTNVLKFVRQTQTFLSSGDTRGDWQQQRLRRYFCGIVECLFDGLATLQDSDRFVPNSMHLTLYRLCEEWCQCGSQSSLVKQRLVTMQTAATAGFTDPQQKAAAIEKFQTETRLLSNAAVGAMASLCQKAYFMPDTSSNSPIKEASPEFLVRLDAASTLDRIVAMLASIHEVALRGGRKALRSLLVYKKDDPMLIDDVLRRSLVTVKDLETSNCRFFQVVADVICTSDTHHFTLSQVISISLANLCSPLLDIRRQAMDALAAIHKASGGSSSLSQFESAIVCSSASIYLGAQLQIAEFLSSEHPTEAVRVLTECSSRLPSVQDTLASHIFSRVLRSLVPWMVNIELLSTGSTVLSRPGRAALFHLMALTYRYSEVYPEEIQSIWSSLVDRQPANGPSIVSFLLQQSSKVGSTAYVDCARKIVACLSRTAMGQHIFEELCDMIEPSRMLPSIDHKFELPTADETDFWADLDALFSEQPKHSLGSGQFALLFLVDVIPTRPWETKKQLPILLHSIFAHLSYRNPFVRDQARKMLFQLLRSWIPGYDTLPDRDQYPCHTDLKASIDRLEREVALHLKASPDSESTEQNLGLDAVCGQVLDIVRPLHPPVADEWGSVALLWGTTCSIRPLAFRSLQIYRKVMSTVTQADVAQLLGRLSNTAASTESNIRSFTAELVYTLMAFVNSPTIDVTLLITVFWCCVACIGTPAEQEFGLVVELLDLVMDRLDLDDVYTIELIAAHKPPQWIDNPSGILPGLLIGLRSSATLGRTLKLIMKLSNVSDPTFIDPSGNRVRDMYTLCLPWCLRAMEDGSIDPPLANYATRVSQLAEEEGHDNIARILTSFVKSRFRTKDDFLRQATAALREHYARHSWSDVVSLLLSLTLNQERWLQVKSIQILKVLFQVRDMKNPADRLGSELLMPLLRLLQTDLAAQALEVLEEPMAISGGPSAKQVLRMSMHIPSVAEDRDSTDVFGIPEESGWCVPKPDRRREVCRANVMAVFDTCKVPTRPSRIEFEDEVDRFAESLTLDDDLGNLVQNLHELSTFFQGEQGKAATPPTTNHQLEARIAAILAKSTDTTALDSPQTPFADVFHFANSHDVDSDEESDSDYGADTFEFDSHQIPTSRRQQDGYYPWNEYS